MRRLLQGLADLVFPPRCIACDALLVQKGGHPFCPSCFTRIHFIRSPLCPCCGVPFPAAAGRDHLCGSCMTSRRYFTAARAVGQYETVLLEAIHRFKYQGRTCIGEVLGTCMAAFDYSPFRIRDYTLIIPVPLHVKRLRERGFNQSVILAREIARRHSLPLDFKVLKRTVFTEHQARLGKDARGPNVRGAFEVVESGRIKGEKVLLVDDVYTTGSTVRECARVLRRNGAKDVAVLTLARAV